jgi:hypothetical protein
LQSKRHWVSDCLRPANFRLRAFSFTACNSPPKWTETRAVIARERLSLRPRHRQSPK